MSDVRLFIGVDLPQALVESVLTIRPRLEPHGVELAWARPESIHVTLKFLGNVSPERIRSIDTSLKDLQALAFKVTVSGVGFFPNRRAPRLLWAGVKSDSLERLANEVDKRMVAVGFPVERRPFTPHLTLARCRGNRTIHRETVRAARQFRDAGFGSCMVECFYLYASRLDHSGATHEKLHRYDLEAQPSSRVTS